MNDIEKCKDALEGETFESAMPTLFFRCESAVFQKDSENSLCYTTTKDRAQLLASILNEWSQIKQQNRKILEILQKIPEWKSFLPEQDVKIIEEILQKINSSL